jgi:hypothetical protein
VPLIVSRSVDGFEGLGDEETLKTLYQELRVAVSVVAALQLDRSRVQAEAERLSCDQLSLTFTKAVQGCCFERDRNA